MLTRLSALLIVLALPACAPRNPQILPPEQLAAAAYRSAKPPEVTVYTVVNKASGSGTHTALLINASERVLYDPASGFEAEGVPRSGDILYGYSPGVEKAYFSVHERHSFRVRTHSFAVSSETAERLLRAAKAQGPAAPAHCAVSTIEILKSEPAFAALQETYSPKKLGQQLDQMPGAKISELTEDMFPQTRVISAQKFDERPDL
ncbi:hypothetical protein ACRARG_08730 [Pseudooceanicola sp. C21-150M6]|uniref:hypothetical protein n=1 Tax=Pseudooceanicola sp. C21-150M6 TaxID=3434355 RepID=UPI003D7FD7AE